MYSLLLLLIYLTFVVLGLPDSLLGSAWPVMQAHLDVPVSYAGIVSMIPSGCAIFSHLASDRLTRRFGSGFIIAAGVLASSLAMFGFSISSSFAMLCLFTIPYGIGGGIIDAALNNYVAVHYAARHMNWLHCFWGVGSVISPYIMGYCLSTSAGWNGGYRIVSLMQAVFAVMLFISLPLWKKRPADSPGARKIPRAHSFSDILRIKGAKYVLLAFFGYGALESMTSFWASSYLVLGRGISVETAARYASLYFIGITVGRFLCGFISGMLSGRSMVRIGIAVLLTGAACVLLPLGSDMLCLVGLVVTGLGCAPIYPILIHSTPDNFGAQNSQSIVGVQMASAAIGSIIMPVSFGVIADNISIRLYPALILALALLVLVATERLNKNIPAPN